MANVAVIGAQWGDEGKGKIVDWLSERADIVVRFQGGHNAGHTLVIGNETYKLALLPSGEGSGSLEPDTVETNDQGEATANWTLGTVPGAQSGEARLVTDLETPPHAPFQASAVAGTPDTVRALSPLNQPGRRGEEVESPPIVVAVDRFGRDLGRVDPDRFFMA